MADVFISYFRGIVLPLPDPAFQMLDAMLEGEPVVNLLYGIVDHIDDAELVAAANDAVDTFLRAFGPPDPPDRPRP